MVCHNVAEVYNLPIFISFGQFECALNFSIQNNCVVFNRGKYDLPLEDGML